MRSHPALDLPADDSPPGSGGLDNVVFGVSAAVAVALLTWGFLDTDSLARVSGDALGFAEVFDSAAVGDPVAIAVRDDAIRAWSVVAVTYCHVVAPEVIVIAGGVARAAGSVIPAMQAYVRKHIWRVLDVPRFVVADDPAISVLRGLAVL